MRMEPRTNAGYEIINSMTVGNTEIVLGENKEKFSQYVTWQCTNGDYYFYGHYHSTLLNAQKDFCNRVLDEIKHLERPHKNHEAER